MDLNNLRNYAGRIRSEDNGLDRKLIARLAGVTFEGRQNVLARMRENTPVRLERDRRNEYDFYAVQVMAKVQGQWQQVGFIPRKMAPLVAKSLDKGVVFTAAVYRITGGVVNEHSGEQLNYGLEIIIKPER